jgi:hypothetical protein
LLGLEEETKSRWVWKLFIVPLIFFLSEPIQLSYSVLAF